MFTLSLDQYRGKRICVALSGGKDSMALAHYLKAHAAQYNIVMSAVNCDHCMRGEESARDSRFVGDYCKSLGIELYSYSAQGLNLCGERAAREWRLSCFDDVIAKDRADFVATAHHMNDNAETVLFNLARGSALSGVTGIAERTARSFIRPLIGVSRAEIDDYIQHFDIPYVTDSTNLVDDYTRNKLRHTVIPALEQAVHGAVENIYRFSRLAAEDEEYLGRVASEYISPCIGGWLIALCAEKVIFRRAAHKVVAVYFRKKDYTSQQFDALFGLQNAENGKKFNFLGLCAVRQDGGIAITAALPQGEGQASLPFSAVYGNASPAFLSEIPFLIVSSEDGGEAVASLNGMGYADLKVLEFDPDAVPEGATVRLKAVGDRFRKFGGGSKSLGDYLTDKKVAQSIRPRLPLIASGRDILAIGGTEISDTIKITNNTTRRAVFVCPNALQK